jgi:hypothetical protein
MNKSNLHIGSWILITLLYIGVMSVAYTYMYRYFYYQFNRPEIAKNYCINKYKMNNNCQGSCFMKRVSETKEIVFLNYKINSIHSIDLMNSHVSQIFDLSIYYFAINKINTSSVYNLHKGYNDEFFKPPCFILCS